MEMHSGHTYPTLTFTWNC